jgi:hypothetical protein
MTPPNLWTFGANTSAFKTLSKISAISMELQIMFKTRAKSTLPLGAILVCPDQLKLQVLMQMKAVNENLTFVSDIKDMSTIVEDDDAESISSSVSSSQKIKNISTSPGYKISKISSSKPKIFIVSFEHFQTQESFKEIEALNMQVEGILFALPPQSACPYVVAARLASLPTFQKKSKKTPLVVVYAQDFEENGLIVAKRVLKREDPVDPVRQSVAVP